MSTFNFDELEILVEWIRARESVRVQKAQGRPFPWTSDPLLRNYRWCNVRRMDDRVSQWLFANFYHREADVATDLAAATLARLVNWPDSLARVIAADTRADRFDLRYHLRFAEYALHDIATAGGKVFTGAYIVPGVPGMSKVASVLRTVRNVAHSPDQLLGGYASTTWLRLCGLDGIGSFLAGQIVADIAHLYTGQIWNDRKTWAPLGPGSQRGMNRLLGRPKNTALKQHDFERLLSTLIVEIKPEIADIWDDRDLYAMDIQNCLCEFDKYRRLARGEGTVRARYRPKAEEEL